MSSSAAPVKSVVLLSGGLDSAANLAFCAKLDRPILALTARYGQRAAEAEARAASRLCAHYGVRHEVIEVSWLGRLGGSSLTDERAQVPELDASVLDDPEVTRRSAKSVWVPNRNGVLINLAAAYAEALGAKRVVVGFNREEAATFPDNSADFISRSSASLELSTANQIRVHSYTVEMNKTEIVKAVRELDPGFPLQEIWSCYHPGDRPCGRCESCQRLARALKAVGVFPEWGIK